MNDERTLPMPARWFIVLVVGAALGWACLHAYRAARAGGDLLAGRQYARMGFGTSAPPMQAWAATRDRLHTALALEPDNPMAHELMGVLAAQRFDDPGLLIEATSHYVRSLTLRPISPNTWANLAEARYLVGDTAQLFRVAIENAARLGPSEPQSQRVVAHYGLAVFDEVGPPTKRAIEAMVAAGMRRDPAEMLSIAQRRGRLDVACRYLAETRRKIDPRWGRLCAR